jgi:hypothetical protein
VVSELLSKAGDPVPRRIIGQIEEAAGDQRPGRPRIAARRIAPFGKKSSISTCTSLNRDASLGTVVMIASTRLTNLRA